MSLDISQSVDEAGRSNRAPAGFALSEAVCDIFSVRVDFLHTADRSGLFNISVLDANKIGVAESFFARDHLVIPRAARDGAIYNFLSKRLFWVFPMQWYTTERPIFFCSDRWTVTDWTVNITAAQHILGSESAVDANWAPTIETTLYTVIAAFLVMSPSFILNKLKRTLSTLGWLCVASKLQYSWLDKTFTRYEQQLVQK